MIEKGPEFRPSPEEELFIPKISPELLKNNYSIWRNHLHQCLEKQYPDFLERKTHLKKFKDFVKFLPLVHTAFAVDLKNIFHVKKLESSFRLRKKGRESWQTTTYPIDEKVGSDRYVFFNFGTGWVQGDVYLLFNQEKLKDPKTIASLEDIFRLHDLYHSLEEALEVYKKQIFRGIDFPKIAALILANVYRNPQEYLSEKKGFPSEIIIPSVQFSDMFPSFEIKVLDEMPLNTLLGIVYPSEDPDMLRKIKEANVPDNQLIPFDSSVYKTIGEKKKAFNRLIYNESLKR